MPKQALKITKTKDRTLVAVTGPMTIMQAQELKEGLLKAFATEKGVELSLAGVTEVDLTGLQLLCSAHRTSLVRGIPFTVAGDRPAAVSEAAQLAGMLHQKGCSGEATCSCVWNAEP